MFYGSMPYFDDITFDALDMSPEVIICLYIDDILIFGSDQDQVDKAKNILWHVKNASRKRIFAKYNIIKQNSLFIHTKPQYNRAIKLQWNSNQLENSKTI